MRFERSTIWALRVFGLGDYSRARRIHQQGVERSREIGYRLGEGDHLDNIGGTAWAVGDYDAAIEHYNKALALRRRMDDAWGVAVSKSNLAATYRQVGKLDEAERLYGEALDIDRSIGRRRGEAYDIHGLGLTYLDRGNLDGAVDALDAASAIRQELGEEHLCNESKMAGALARMRRGDRNEAGHIVRTVLDAEGSQPFEGAVETTASYFRAIEVLKATDPGAAATLQANVAAAVRERANRISDPEQRRSYLGDVADHRRATAD